MRRVLALVLHVYIVTEWRNVSCESWESIEVGSEVVFK